MRQFSADALYTNLLWHRAVTGMTWVDIAEQCGTTVSAFTRISHGGKPDADLLVRLLDMMGMLDYFLEQMTEERQL